MQALLSRAVAVTVMLSLAMHAGAQGAAPPPGGAGAGGGATAGGQTAPAPRLGVGSPAPGIKVGKWFKGTPITELKEGHVYVMEFWATWCVPCIAAMPHVTELQKKYEGKMTVIGVSVWERPTEKTDASLAELVGPFVEKQGEKMGYHVAVDTVDDLMAEHWIKAIGQDGVPCTIIVGKDKKIAWIGLPADMDKPLEAIVAGTYDVKAEAERIARAKAKEETRAALLKPVREALIAKDPKAVLAAVDKAVAQEPELETLVFPVRFEALLQSDEAAGFAYLKQWTENGGLEKESTHGYNAFVALSRNADKLKNADWTLMAQVLEKTNTLRGMKDPQILVAGAAAYFSSGQKAKAVEYQEKALAIAEAASTSQPAWVETQRKKLDEYKAAR